MAQISNRLFTWGLHERESKSTVELIENAGMFKEDELNYLDFVLSKIKPPKENFKKSEEMQKRNNNESSLCEPFSLVPKIRKKCVFLKKEGELPINTEAEIVELDSPDRVNPEYFYIDSLYFCLRYNKDTEVCTISTSSFGEGWFDKKLKATPYNYKRILQLFGFLSTNNSSVVEEETTDKNIMHSKGWFNAVEKISSGFVPYVLSRDHICCGFYDLLELDYYV